MKFLSDRPQLTYDPFAKNMEAIERIRAALRRKNMLHLRDYDADGVCGVSMMELFALDTNFSYYIPSRLMKAMGLIRPLPGLKKEEWI